MDNWYDYQEVLDIVAGFGLIAHHRARGVVEHADIWMNRLRRLLARWEKKPENYIALLHFAFVLIAFRAIALFG